MTGKLYINQLSVMEVLPKKLRDCTRAPSITSYHQQPDGRLWIDLQSVTYLLNLRRLKNSQVRQEVKKIVEKHFKKDTFQDHWRLFKVNGTSRRMISPKMCRRLADKFTGFTGQKRLAFLLTEMIDFYRLSKAQEIQKEKRYGKR